MRAVAKPTITSTPPITSTNFTGRDYLRVQRTRTRNLHNRNGFCTGRRSVQREGKAPPFSKLQTSQATGLLFPFHLADACGVGTITSCEKLSAAFSFPSWVRHPRSGI